MNRQENSTSSPEVKNRFSTAVNTMMNTSGFRPFKSARGRIWLSAITPARAANTRAYPPQEPTMNSATI